jgi:enoyl-CoA hydratase/carnithine racemase
MAESDVLYEQHDAVALLTLNRPERLNAWNGDLAARYFGLLQQCADDPSVRVIVVTGAGRGWCAGADMETLTAIGDSDGSTGADQAAGGTLQSFTTRVPKPVIAAVNGACAGIGMAQALFCDLRFAAAGAKFTTSFARRGLIAEYGMSWALTRLVGTANATDLLLSGRVVLAEEAATMGMVNRVCAPEVLLDETMAYAHDLAVNCSPASMAVMKRQIWADLQRPLAEGERDAIRFMRQTLMESDFIEGVQSFMGKRAPSFRPLDASNWALLAD